MPRGLREINYVTYLRRSGAVRRDRGPRVAKMRRESATGPTMNYRSTKVAICLLDRPSFYAPADNRTRSARQRGSFYYENKWYKWENAQSTRIFQFLRLF